MTSARSTLPWRSSQKNRAPTSLSLVVATPEVASPLASAVAHLPPIKMISDAKTRSSAVEGVYPVHLRASKTKLYFQMSNQRRIQRPNRHKTTTVSSSVTSDPTFILVLLLFEIVALFHADVKVDSGFWHDAFRTLLLCLIPSSDCLFVQTSHSPDRYNSNRLLPQMPRMYYQLPTLMQQMPPIPRQRHLAQRPTPQLHPSHAHGLHHCQGVARPTFL